MTRSETYASFTHPSRNPISFDALFTQPVSPLTLESRLRIDRITTESQAVLDQVKRLLGDLDQASDLQC